MTGDGFRSGSLVSIEFDQPKDERYDLQYVFSFEDILFLIREPRWQPGTAWHDR